jgi:T-complex protein 1 subunit alpha
MASMFEQPRNGTLFLGGQKISGSDIRDQNGMSVYILSRLLLHVRGKWGRHEPLVLDFK